MSYIVEIVTPPEALPFGDLVERCSGARVELEQVVPADEGLLPFFWIRGVDPEVADGADETDPALDEVTVLEDTGNALLCRTVWNRDVPGFQHVLLETGVTLLEAVGTGEGWEFQCRFSGQDEAREFRAELRERGVPFEVVRVYSLRQMEEQRYGLTQDQYETLSTIHEAGFFRTPRETSLEAVADRFSVTPQALSTRYRRALDTLLGEALHVEEGDEGT